MDYEPLNEWILVKRLEKDASKIRGIHVPEQFQRASNEGTVVAIGAGVQVSVEEGDLILFSEYSNMPIELDGEEFLLVRGIDTFLRKKVSAKTRNNRTAVLSA